MIFLQQGGGVGIIILYSICALSITTTSILLFNQCIFDHFANHLIPLITFALNKLNDIRVLIHL